jgi:hypothetical protein
MLQPVSLTKTQGNPAFDDSPWMLAKISQIFNTVDTQNPEYRIQ